MPSRLAKPILSSDVYGIRSRLSACKSYDFAGTRILPGRIGSVLFCVIVSFVFVVQNYFELANPMFAAILLINIILRVFVSLKVKVSHNHNPIFPNSQQTPFIR